MTNTFYHNYDTRRPLNLCLPTNTLYIFQNSALYNKLPEHNKNASSLQGFKESIIELYIKECYYSVEEYFELFHLIS